MRGIVMMILTLVATATACHGPTNNEPRVGHGAVHVSKGERVDDAVAFGGDLTVQGWVTGDAVALGGGVHLLPGARVDGDVVALGGTLNVAPGALVQGDQVSTSGDWSSWAGGLTAKETWQGRPWAGAGWHHGGWRDDSSSRWGSQLERVGHLVGMYLLMVLLGTLMLGLAPLRTRALAAAVAAHPGKSLGFGLLVILGTTVTAIVLTLSIVGIPLALILGGVVACAACVGLAGVSILLGELLPLLSLRERPYTKLMLGAGALVLALALPYVGGLLTVMAVVIGLGSLTVTRWRPGHAVFAGKGPYRRSPVV